MFLRYISVAPYLPRLSDSDSQNVWFSIELKLVSFLPNFDVIRTKEAEVDPVYITCFGRGKR